MLNPAMTSDQSPKLQQDSTTDRLEAARTEQRRSKFDNNWQLSQEIFSPTQSISETQFHLNLQSHLRKPLLPQNQPSILFKSQQKIGQQIWKQSIDLLLLKGTKLHSLHEDNKEKKEEKEKIVNLERMLELLV